MSALRHRRRTVRSYEGYVTQVVDADLLPDHDIRRLMNTLRPTALSDPKSKSDNKFFVKVFIGRYNQASGPSAKSYSKQIVAKVPSTKPSAHQVTAMFEKELGALKALTNNWDGYGAEIPSNAVIERLTKILIAFVRQGLIPAKILASAMGGAGLIFTNSDRVVTIQVLNNGITTLALKSGREPSQRSVVNERNSLLLLVGTVVAFLSGNELVG